MIVVALLQDIAGKRRDALKMASLVFDCQAGSAGDRGRLLE